MESRKETDISKNALTDKRDALTDKSIKLTDILTDINKEKLEGLSNYLLSRGRIDNATTTKFLQCSSSTAKRILRLLSQKELLIAQGNNKGRVYILNMDKVKG